VSGKDGVQTVETRVAEVALVDVPGNKHGAGAPGGWAEKDAWASRVAIARLKVAALQFPWLDMGAIISHAGYGTKPSSNGFSMAAIGRERHILHFRDEAGYSLSVHVDVVFGQTSPTKTQAYQQSAGKRLQRNVAARRAAQTRRRALLRQHLHIRDVVLEIVNHDYRLDLIPPHAASRIRHPASPGTPSSSLPSNPRFSGIDGSRFRFRIHCLDNALHRVALDRGRLFATTGEEQGNQQQERSQRYSGHSLTSSQTIFMELATRAARFTSPVKLLASTFRLFASRFGFIAAVTWWSMRRAT
jgi:hypothetical protein